MVKKKILIIDDDVDICMLLKRFFERNNYDVEIAFKGKEGIDLLKDNKVDLVLTDFRLPDKNGFEMLEAIKSINEEIPVIIITGYSEVNQAIKAIRLGAHEYVTKPIYPEEILLLIQDALSDSTTNVEFEKESTFSEQKPVEQENDKRNPSQVSSDTYIIPNSESSKKIQQLINLVAPTNMTVVIIGESGTGKEVAARMIHDASERKGQAFIPVDCGALPQELASSELFGHVKGAFTGATSDKKGSFELAHNGTLFLDEIGNLSYENQVKLLRVLQERVIRKVGSEKDKSIDVRIIVATNEDLSVAMEKGDFREDIYYRINEFKIELPPLRNNHEALNDYIQFFIDKASDELGMKVSSLNEEVLKLFSLYDWPGNLRELKNVIKYAVLMSEGSIIEKQNLPVDILKALKNLQNKNSFRGVKEGQEESLLLKDITANAEIKAILNALEIANNNKTQAAEILGIDRKTLYNKLNNYDLLDT
ncbi:sigma-54-dependent transcriptional regulator [Brumimicrobium aurantiacum]|uniref:Sigma-54-dependent Fis family transcriptional regulator n=1 Tax=Brumimicrobium aurantiacum TaxID=1737063 RepID=A0A3E1EWA0_9FLAO|nr:sigma-54 dependent transcriptional regulator [Brumimicrobium aurantiacum]RFC53798.1 sigma-54-dependent Fis family transcriptional regulator [Brumimicrobium aurantiacum]